ncbi:hypothetical protein LCGC14_1098350 [marine sediment metagenome]|uniref:Uncharacterized protein n=1 Tax=marine sediment metagenome TaxID=412755 RepID=A0A0F9PTF3_9ZZZZ
MDEGLELLRTPVRHVATGNTYPYREAFTSWAWHWDTARQAWIEENGTAADEPGILAIKNLPGVKVIAEPDSKGE